MQFSALSRYVVSQNKVSGNVLDDGSIIVIATVWSIFVCYTSRSEVDLVMFQPVRQNFTQMSIRYLLQSIDMQANCYRLGIKKQNFEAVNFSRAWAEILRKCQNIRLYLDLSITAPLPLYLQGSINSFPDYKHLLQENYVEYKHIF
jgi:hypothetical protein